MYFWGALEGTLAAEYHHHSYERAFRRWSSYERYRTIPVPIEYLPTLAPYLGV